MLRKIWFFSAQTGQTSQTNGGRVHKRMSAGALALAMLTTPVMLTVAQPANASTQSIRDDYRQLAEDSLTAINWKATDGDPDDDGLRGIELGYRAKLVADLHFNGDYNASTSDPDDVDPQSALADFTKPYWYITKSDSNGTYHGFRDRDEWDSMNDGSVNDPDTIYTVAQTDHYGPALLEATAQGALDPQYLNSVLDLLVNHIPVISTPYGDCMVYSDNPNDDEWCAINVSAGAASFLKKAQDAGFSIPGQSALIDDLKPLVANTYGAAYNQPSSVMADDSKSSEPTTQDLQDHTYEHYWPYAWVPGHGRWTTPGFTRPDSDYNHEAYTVDSAIELGLSVGHTANQYHLNYTQYAHEDRAWPYDDTQANRIRDVVGRMRMQSLDPSVAPEGMLSDALWYHDTFGGDKYNYPASEDGQVGMWALRLSNVAVAEDANTRLSNWIATPKLYDNSADREPITGRVSSDNVIYFRATVRRGASPEWYFIPRKTVKMVRTYPNDGQVMDTKPTGQQGNISFSWETPHTHDLKRCFKFVVPGESESNPKCVTTKQ